MTVADTSKAEDIHIAVVSTGYRCKDYLSDWYNSLLAQTHTNWSVICYLDWDDKEDDTPRVLTNIACAEPRITSCSLSFNRCGCSRGTWHAAHHIDDPETVIATLDLDDWLEPDALAKVAERYASNPELRMTYGTYVLQTDTGCSIQEA